MKRSLGQDLTKEELGGSKIAVDTAGTIDNVVDTTTGTVKGKARFANPTGALFPNQFVNVTVLVDTLKNQVIVPTTAVRHGPAGDFVWVAQAASGGGANQARSPVARFTACRPPGVGLLPSATGK